MRWLSPELTPKLLTVFREGYGRREAARDVLAGIVVGIVALPLGIAFAIASGVRPEQGLYTAIIAGFLISVFGGSRVQIGGPTGAFVVIVAGVVAEFGYPGLAIATVMAGVLLCVMAIARLGDVIRFIPYPVIVGFTSGIALIIAASQIGDALGLDIGRVPAGFVETFAVYRAHVHELHVPSVALFLLTLVVLQLWPRVTRRVPSPLVALVVTTAVAQLAGLDVDTIGSRFGAVSSALPRFAVPVVEWRLVPELVSPAISIALLAAIESLLSALVADGLISGRHRSNAELLGQGIANIATPFFGGIPATGAIARTATNIRNGGRSPIAGIVHAITLLVILLVAGKWAALVPMATLAGILMIVAYNMSEWRVFVRLFRGPRSDVLVLVTTFALTVAIDLVVAIQAGVVLAALLFMRRMADVTQVKPLHEILDYESSDVLASAPVELPDGVEVFAINGSFCFGAARKFTETLLAMRTRPRIVILRMRHVLAIDATGVHALEDVAKRLRDQGTRLFLAGVNAHPLAVLRRSGTLAAIGEERVFATFADAVAAVRAMDAASGKAD